MLKVSPLLLALLSLSQLLAVPLDLDVFRQVKRWKQQAAKAAQAPTKAPPALKVLCEKTSTAQLLSRLGPAFNHRYMSVAKPLVPRSQRPGKLSPAPPGFQSSPPARPLANHGAFAVDAGFRRSLPRRVKRESGRGVAPCLKEVSWFDFGPDVFPRYIRMARCRKEGRSCFVFGRCRARAFTVQLLRRTGDGCVPEVRTEVVRRTLGELAAVRLAPHLANVTVPVKFERVVMVEEWRWEERAVTFCCECIYCRGSVCV